MKYYLNNAVWDIEKGTILKLGEGKEIMHAVLGFDKFTNEKIREVYGPHPVFHALKWPETNKQLESAKGAHWTMMGFNECYKVPIVCHITDCIKRGIVKKSYRHLAFDLNEVAIDQLESVTSDFLWPARINHG